MMKSLNFNPQIGMLKKLKKWEGDFFSPAHPNRVDEILKWTKMSKGLPVEIEHLIFLYIFLNLYEEWQVNISIEI